MADSTMTELIALTRHMVGFPAPAAGGADKLDDTHILRWLNDWFKSMAESIFGIPVYLEFTVSVAGVCTVVTTNSSPVVTTDLMAAGQRVEDFTFLSWPDIRSISQVINRTSGVAETDDAIMLKMSRNSPNDQWDLRGSSDYYSGYDYEPGKGIVLLPKTITAINTIRVNYKQEFQRLTGAQKPSSFFSEDDTMAPVLHAAYYCAVVLGLEEPDRFWSERDKVTRAFVTRAYTKDTGPAMGFDNLNGMQFRR